MNNNNTVAVDIMVRTQLNNASQNFNRELSKMNSDAAKYAASMRLSFENQLSPAFFTRLGKQAAEAFARGYGKPQTNVAPSSGVAPPPQNRGGGASSNGAQREMAQMAANAEKYSQQIRNTFAKNLSASFFARLAQQASAAFNRNLKFNTISRDLIGGLASGINSGSSSAFKAVQTLANGIISTAKNVLGIKSPSTVFLAIGKNIGQALSLGLSMVGVSFISDYIGKAIELATERANAFKGLQSIANFKGIDANAANDSVKNLRLVKGGILGIADATTALKNLLATGFSLPEATQLIERFSDSAAFGKQAALNYGEAIKGATEGIKNGNSILVDNAGVTKNLSKILEENGKKITDVSNITSDASVRMALFKGIIKETAGQVGDADKLMQGWTGTIAANKTAQDNLLVSIGNIITSTPELTALINLSTQGLREQTAEFDRAGSASEKNTRIITRGFAKMGMEAYIFANSTASVFKEFGNTVALVFASLLVGWHGFVHGMQAAYNATIVPLMNTLVSGLNIIQRGYQSIPRGVFDAIGKGEVYDEVQKMQPYGEFQSLTSGSDGLKFATQRLRFLADNMGKEFTKAGQYADMLRKRYADLTEEAKRSLEAEKNNTKGKQNNTKSTDAESDAKQKAAKAAKVTMENFGSLRELRQSSGNTRIDSAIVKAARENNLDPNLLFYQLKKESGFRNDLVSPKGAVGIAQFLPDTARRFGVTDPLNIEKAIAGMARIMSMLSSKYGGGEEGYKMALAGYNAGWEGRKNFPSIEARLKFAQTGFKETSDYVKTIIGNYKGTLGRTKDGKTAPSFGEFDEQAEQIRLGKVRAEYLRNAWMANVPDTVDAGSTGITTSVAPQLNLDQQYVEKLKESLNIVETINEVVMRTHNFQEETGLRVLSALVEQDKNFLDVHQEIDVQTQLNADSLYRTRQRELSILREMRDLREEQTELEDKIATFWANSQQRINNSALQDRLELLEREETAIKSINRSYLELNQQSQYSANQANASVLEFMASQKGVTQTMADFKIGLIETGYDFIDRGLDAIIPKLGKVSDLIKDVLSSFIRLVVNQAFRRMFGLDGTQAVSGGQKGSVGIAGVVQQMILGGGSSSGGGGFTSGGFGSSTTPAFNPTQSIQQILGGGGSTRNPFAGWSLGGNASGAPDVSGAPTAVGSVQGVPQPKGGIGGMLGGFNLKDLKGSIGGLAPMLGAGLGAMLGGTSGIGGILGSAGGLIGGTLLGGLLTSGSIGGATTGGIFGSSAGIFGLGTATFGVGLAVAGGLMALSYLFGRAKRRREEKKQVSQLTGDAVRQIQTLLDNVKSMKVDGKTAYEQGTQIRDQFKEQISKLKTSPAKKQAQADLAKINSMLSTLKTEGQLADNLRTIAQQTDERLVPTFAVGGFTGFSYGARSAVVHSHEAILRQQDIAALGGYRRLQEAGVRGMNMSPQRTVASSNSSGSMPPIYIVGVFDEDTADSMFDKVSALGLAKKVRFASKEGLGKMNEAFEDYLVGK